MSLSRLFFSPIVVFSKGGACRAFVVTALGLGAGFEIEICFLTDFEDGGFSDFFVEVVFDFSWLSSPLETALTKWLKGVSPPIRTKNMMAKTAKIPAPYIIPRTAAFPSRRRLGGGVTFRARVRFFVERFLLFCAISFRSLSPTPVFSK